MHSDHVAIIGGGPAGLMAAEVISSQGIAVDLYDAMPSVGRKFLMAGKSGLNLTHAEPFEKFIARYGERRHVLENIIHTFSPADLQAWAKQLGVETFVGSSQRVFPRDMKAAPLLRAWLRRLRSAGVHFHMRHKWTRMMANGALQFDTPEQSVTIKPCASVLATGGGSWRRLGSTGEWVSILERAGIHINTLQPANCGFDVSWSDHIRDNMAGQPVKSVTITFTNAKGETHTRNGEFVISQYGIEGSLVYALSADIRDMITRHGKATLLLDLLPAYSYEVVLNKLTAPRGKRTLSEFLRRQLGLRGVKMALLYERAPKETLQNPQKLAALIKALPLICERTRPIDEAISTAGGVSFDALDTNLMLQQYPGVFCAGEMLDWEAPTGGYLLTACIASGVVAGRGVVKFLQNQQRMAGI